MGAGMCSRRIVPADNRAWAEPPEDRPLITPTANYSPQLYLFGLSDSGKTSLVQFLHSGGQFFYVPPSREVQSQHTQIDYEGRILEMVDCSGWPKFRWKWPFSAAKATAIIFMIDASDALRIPLAWTELLGLVHTVTHVRTIPLLVCLNKLDVMNLAARTADIREAMSVLRPITHSCWCIAEISVFSGQGVHPAMHWLMDKVKSIT
jgi:GTPase SAR1 family protein